MHQTKNDHVRRGWDAYRSMHYPESRLGWPGWLYALWRKACCRRERHLFSEVYSVSGGPHEHYLVCDACQLMANIESIDTTYSERYGVGWNGHRTPHPMREAISLEPLLK